MGSATPGALGAVFAALYAAHQVADHWIQTQHQADLKSCAGWRGRLACAAHVASYTATALAALVAVAWRTGLDLTPAGVAAGLAVSAVSHYVADRRTPLRWMADRLGKDPGWLKRGGGLYALDQSWHIGWLFVAALLIGGR
jgi:hypothetical protein